MTQTYVIFDSRSGRIIGVHHGAVNADFIRRQIQRRIKIEDRHIAEISTTSKSFDPQKAYKIDLSRKALVEVAHAEHGAGGGFGFVHAK